MLSRRDFLSHAAGATVTLVLTPILCTACSSSDSGTSSSTNPTFPGCDGVGETSTVTESHTHDLCVPTADLASPPAAGMTYTTSTFVDHSHGVTLSQAQLQAIQAGQTVTVASTAADTAAYPSHDHGFTIAMAASTQPAPTVPGY